MAPLSLFCGSYYGSAGVHWHCLRASKMLLHSNFARKLKLAYQLCNFGCWGRFNNIHFVELGSYPSLLQVGFRNQYVLFHNVYSRMGKLSLSQRAPRSVSGKQNQWIQATSIDFYRNELLVFPPVVDRSLPSAHYKLPEIKPVSACLQSQGKFTFPTTGTQVK